MQNNNKGGDPGQSILLNEGDIANLVETCKKQTEIFQLEQVDTNNSVVVRKSGSENMVHNSGNDVGKSTQTVQQIESLNMKAKKNPQSVSVCKEWCKTALSELEFNQYDSAYNFICEGLKEMEKISKS